MTFFDFDDGLISGTHRIVESLCISSRILATETDYPGYYAGAEIDVTHLDTLCDGKTAGSSIKFSSTRRGFACDNPADPLDLFTIAVNDCPNSNDASLFPIDLKDRVVELVFQSISKFEITLGLVKKKIWLFFKFLYKNFLSRLNKFFSLKLNL